MDLDVLSTYRFNTQPPEGGWGRLQNYPIAYPRFNTQPPEGGWNFLIFASTADIFVSTHSRLKAAG